MPIDARRLFRLRRMHAREGFTLVEVLVAMLILAIGLLGLEALGIGAARSVAMANRQSQYAKIASDSMESAVYQLRSGSWPARFCENRPRGERLSRNVTVQTAGGRDLATVLVLAIPPAAGLGVPRDTFRVSSSIYLPNTIPGGVGGSPCS